MTYFLIKKPRRTNKFIHGGIGKRYTYIKELKYQQDTVGNCFSLSIPSFPCSTTKSKGRPLLLCKQLDKKVQSYIMKAREACGVITARIVVAAAVGLGQQT